MGQQGEQAQENQDPELACPSAPHLLSWVAAICSEMSPNRKTTTASWISSAEPMGILPKRQTFQSSVRDAQHQGGEADREEDLQRTVERDDLENDQQEADTVSQDPDLALAGSGAGPSPARTRRCDRPSSTPGRRSSDRRSRWAAGGGSRAACSRLAALKPEVRSAMGRPVSQEASAVEDGVAEGPDRGLIVRRAGPDHHVVVADGADQAHGLCRVVLAVAVHEQHHAAIAPHGCPS